MFPSVGTASGETRSNLKTCIDFSSTHFSHKCVDFCYIVRMKYHSVTEKIQKLLGENNIWFETFEHEAVRTSEEAAKVRTGYTLEQGAKALITRVKKDGVKTFVMIVVPGDRKFNKEKLKSVFGLTDVRFATEDEAKQITGGVEFGGVPPLGNLFDLPVYFEKDLTNNDKIIFNAGDRCFSVGMRSEDYVRLVNPSIGAIT